MTAPSWTPEQQLTELMRLPWTIVVEHDPTDGSLVAQVAEIHDAIGTGATIRELSQDLWESLWASLEIRLEHNDPIPLPNGATLPWEGERPPSAIRHVVIEVGQQTGDVIVRPMAAA